MSFSNEQRVRKRNSCLYFEKKTKFLLPKLHRTIQNTCLSFVIGKFAQVSKSFLKNLFNHFNFQIYFKENVKHT